MQLYKFLKKTKMVHAVKNVGNFQTLSNAFYNIDYFYSFPKLTNKYHRYT